MRTMKKILCLSLLFIGASLHAQQRILWRCDKVTQLIFPAEIVKFRSGYTSNDALSQSDGRVLYMQPVDVLPESNLNVITSDGRYYTFDVVYDPAAASVNYIIDSAAAFFQETNAPIPVAEPSADSIPDTLSSASAHSPARICNQVRTMPDYIKVNNVARLQKLVFILTGVYADAKHVYFKFRLENSSNVPFDVDCIAFSVGARKSKKTSTQERIQLFPTDVDKPIHRVDAKSRCEVIYCFEKFTIGKDKVLLAEVLEAGGDRNLCLVIPEHFIIEARHL